MDVPLHLFVTLILALLWTVASTGTIVESLPGFEGPLPFKLETGYVEVGENNDSTLFYYFVESGRNPKEDPIILWLAGGPRCSALTGLLFENGPLSFKINFVQCHGGGYSEGERNDDIPALELNPYAWTQVANIIFLDQPVGTGFSYSKSGRESDISDTKSARDTYHFVLKWFADHPQFSSNPFYVCGISYAGLILPVVVQSIISGMEASKEPLLNFKGYSLGNPITNRDLEYNAQVPFAHGMGLISDELYQSLERNCKGKYIISNSSNVRCLIDLNEFSQCISGVNAMDILEPVCHSPRPEQEIFNHNRRSISSVSEGLYSPCCSDQVFSQSERWANNKRVQVALHIKKANLILGKWVWCNYHGRADQPDYGIAYENDVKNTVEYHRNIKGYRSLIYSGDQDMVVSYVSTQTWIRSLNLSIVDDWRPYYLDGQVVGFRRTFSNGMTYATVKGGGHVTSMYKPIETFFMFKMWISNVFE